MEKAKLWFWILFDLFVAVIVVCLLFFVAPAIGRWGSSLVPAKTLTVSAQGMTTATPDLAELTFSVVTQGANPSTLSDNNNQKMASVMQFVESQGIASSDIKTTSYDLQPNYGYGVVTPEPLSANAGAPAVMIMPTKTQTIVSYTLTQTVEVKIHDLTKVASTVGGLAPLGVNQIGGINFTFNDPNAVTALARADAIQKAQEKAQAMAQEAGASLGGIVNLNESTYFPMPMAYNAASGVALGAAVASTPTIAPGTQDITDTVNVTYAIN